MVLVTLKMEEQIIEAVRPHLVLYDTNHSDYMKSKLKQDIWSAIAKDLNLSNALCHVVFPVLRLFALRPPTFQYALTLCHAVFPVLRSVPRSDLPCVRLRLNVRLTLWSHISYCS